jgi:hypothetical protein
MHGELQSANPLFALHQTWAMQDSSCCCCPLTLQPLAHHVPAHGQCKTAAAAACHLQPLDAQHVPTVHTKELLLLLLVM